MTLTTRLYFFSVLLAPISVYSATGKTFFMPRPILNDNVFERAIVQNAVSTIETKGQLYQSNSLFYEESTNTHDITRYFFPHNKTILSVKDAGAQGDRDISGDWLNISSKTLNNAFQSRISACMRANRFGYLLQYHKKIEQLSPHLWMSIFLPFIEAQTNVHFREFDIQNQEAPQDNDPSIDVSQNAQEAFSNNLWQFGKIKSGKQKRAGLADINLKVGYDYSPYSKNILTGFYGSVIIPAGFRPKNEFMFEPLIGNGEHFGLGIGKHFEYKLYHHKNHTVNLLANIDYHYLFESTEVRSFDLLPNDQWSRYLEIIQQNLPNQVQYGINFFTKALKVTPRSMLNIFYASHYRYKSFNIEGGYNAWIREREKIKFRNPWAENIGIASENAGNPAIPDGKTQPNATIATNKMATSGPFVPINPDAINLRSAAHPSAFSHKFYTTSGIDMKWKNSLLSLYLGCSYEFGSHNTNLDKWAVWTSFNLSI